MYTQTESTIHVETHRIHRTFVWNKPSKLCKLCPWIYGWIRPFFDYPWFGHPIVARSTNPTTNISLGTIHQPIQAQAYYNQPWKLNQLLDPWFTANTFSDVNLGFYVVCRFSVPPGLFLVFLSGEADGGLAYVTRTQENRDQYAWHECNANANLKACRIRF